MSTSDHDLMMHERNDMQLQRDTLNYACNEALRERDEAREQVRVLRECIDDWLQYEADSSDCPNCEACANFRPPDACIFKNAAFFLDATATKP